MGAAGKRIGVSVVSLILVVGAVIGVVAVVKSSNSKSGDEKSSDHISMATKAVETICAATEYKDVCARSLAGIAKNVTATPKDFVMAAVEATLQEFKNAFEVTGKTVVDKATDPLDHMATEDCKELLDQAIFTLQASYSTVGDSDQHTLQDRADELRSWMTAVYSLQSTCKDQIQKQEYRSVIENGMVNATQLSHNAINIVAELSKVFEALGVSLLNPSAKSRRLMGANSYPSWFKTEDRRLLRGNGGGRLRPHVVVAKDGSGQFRTVGEAINAYPKNHQGRFIIYVKPGVYDEFIIIDKNKPNILIYGDDPYKTIITGRKNYGILKIGTMDTATFSNNAVGFIARSLTFRNEAGPEGHQAVALRITGDKSAIFNCHIEGYQDTLYYHTSRQFYRNCKISGTIDFIFGMGDAVIQNSEILVRKPLPKQFNTVTADGREVPRATNGLVLQNCRIVPDKDLFPERFQIATYLGRPWKALARTVVMQSELGDFIRPEGWLPWSTTDPKYFYHKTCNYNEFANRGPGADTNRRDTANFKNFKVLSPQEAAQYTPGPFLHGYGWLKYISMPYQIGL